MDSAPLATTISGTMDDARIRAGAAAYRGFLATNIRAGLYAVTLPGTPVPESLLAGAMAGFEMALV